MVLNFPQILPSDSRTRPLSINGWNSLTKPVDPAGVVGQAEVDVVGVLLLLAIVQGKALHHEEGRDDGNADPHLVLAALRQGAGDDHFQRMVEGNIDPARSPHGHPLNDLVRAALRRMAVFAR